MIARPERLPLIAATATAIVALIFAGATRHAWEDYYITFRASLNLATGHGLVFQEGERVHTFTSPLGTLLPALFAVGGGEGAAARALWCFRIVSAAALGGALWMAGRAMLRSGLAPLAVVAACAAWGLDAKTIDFSINGMETALLVFFVTLTWRAFSEGARLAPCALALAGLQWTRPDGCVFFAVIGCAWLLFGAEEKRWSGPSLRRVVAAVAIGAAIYLPWIVFAWIYYGSPIPHTIQAKISPHAPGELVTDLLLYPVQLLFGQAAMHDVFRPAYFFFGGWPAATGWFARVLATGAAVAWVFPALRPAGRIASFAFFLGGFYVEYIPRSPWYYPGWEALGFITWAHILSALLGAERRAAITGARVGAALLVLLQLALLVAVGCEMRVQQSIIEDGHRIAIGRWLRQNARPGDRVYLEPLGYIGFFSGLKMLDYPGLASPEVVAARRAGNHTYAQIIAKLQPEWLVLRKDQVDGLMAENRRLVSGDYRLAQVFDVRPLLDAVRVLPGRRYLEFDALYFVFQRTAAPAAVP